jgi:tetratricopeptide (TPR) repeat protein
MSGSHSSNRVSRREWGVLLCVLVVMFLAYQPAWWGTPIWDDNHHLTPPPLRSVPGLVRIWTDIGATTQYYPLLHSTFWALHAVWGDAVIGYHLFNLTLHAVCTALVLLTLRRLAVPGALLAASLFALHPIQVESVAWMTEIKNTLSTCFYLLAALTYLRFDDTRSRRAYAASLGIFVLALLTKSVTGMLPFTLATVLWWKRGALRLRADVIPLVPFAALGISMGLVTAWWEIKFNRTGAADFAMTWTEQVLVGGRAALFQLGSLLWPANLLFSYPRWNINAGDWRQYVYPSAVVIGLAAAWLTRHRTRAPLAAALFFLFSLAPTLGAFKLYTFRYSYVADHYQYVACIGIFALAAAVVWPWLTASAATTRVIARTGVTATLIVCAVLTWRQSHDYASGEASYAAILRGNPDSWFAHANLGALHLESAPDAAIAHLKEAIRLKPDLGEAHGNLGRALLAKGQVRDAIMACVRALELNPRLFGANHTLAEAYVQAGRPDAAIEHFERALQVNPDDARIRNSLAFALAQIGRPSAAAEEHRRALAIDSRSAAAHYGLGNVYQAQGRLAEAVAEYRSALALDAGGFDTHNNLGVALDRLNRPDEAEREFRAALNLRPGFVDAAFNLAGLLERVGRLPEAARLYGDLVINHPGDLEIRLQLASVLVRLGRRDEAAHHVREVIRRKPDHPIADPTLKSLIR